MKKGPQRDWAERTAKRFVAKIYGNFLHGKREQDILTKLLRRAEKQGYERGVADCRVPAPWERRRTPLELELKRDGDLEP